MLEVLDSDFVRTARAKGATPYSTVFGHALPNAALPIITVIGLQLGGLYGGAIVTETVFGWPGVNTMALSAITYPRYARYPGLCHCRRPVRGRDPICSSIFSTAGWILGQN